MSADEVKTAKRGRGARAREPLRAPPTSVANLWQPLGPATVLQGAATGGPRVAGRINALCVDDAGNRVYAAAANGGVWFSGDGGVRWESLGGLDATHTTGIDRSAHRQACGAIAVTFGAGGAADVVYVGTGEVVHPYGTSAQDYMSGAKGRPFGGVGILRGERPAAGGAVNWVREAPNLVGSGVYRLALEPGGAGVVAATLTGLYQRPLAPGADVDWVRPIGAPFDTLDVECTDVLWTAGSGARPARLWVWVQSGPNAGLWSRAGNAGDFIRVETPGARGRRAVLAASSPPDQVWVLADQPDDVTRGPTAARSAEIPTARAPLPPGAEDGCLNTSDDVRHGFVRLREGIRPVTYCAVDGQAIFEGDIVLGTVDEVEAFTAEVRAHLDEAGASDEDSQAEVLRGIAITGAALRWPGGLVPWVTQASLRNTVLGAIRHWEEHTRIRFVERVAANQAFYPNWVSFQVLPGCSSPVGMQGGGAQVIRLGSGCDVGRAVHEIGHSLGLWHEQSRADRNTYVTIVLANIDPTKAHNFNQHIADGTDIGPYDYGSIMHYGRKDFSVNGGDTVVPKGGQAIGQRRALSPGDIAAIRTIYPDLNRPLLFRVAAAGAGAPVARPVLGLPDVAGQRGVDSLALAVDPSAPNRVVLGGEHLATTTPDGVAIGGDAAIAVADVSVVNGYLQYGGATNVFTMLGIGVPSGVHDLRFSNAGARLWVACDGGVFRSDDPASRVGFQPRNDGLNVTEVIDVAAHPRCEGYVVASALRDELLERESTTVWRLQDHLGAGGLAFDPLDLRRFIVQRGPGRWAASDGSRTGGELLTRGTSTARSEQVASARYSMPATIGHRRGDPTPASANVRQLIVGTNRLWYSEDFGGSWVTLPTGTDPLPANLTRDAFEEAITACVWQSADVAWVLGASRVVRHVRTAGSDAGGGPGTWTSEVVLRRTVKPKKDSTAAAGPIRQAGAWTCIAVNLDPPSAAGQPPVPHGPKGALYLGTSGKAGQADVDTLWWFDGTSRFLPTGLRPGRTGAPVTAIVCDPASPNEVYVGTTVGMYKGVRSQIGTADPTWAWTGMSNGLPEAPVERLALFSDGGLKLLRAGIAGRGVWELRLDTADVPSLAYVRVHADDLRHRPTVALIGRDGSSSRSWHGSPDIRPRAAPAVIAAPGTLPWTRRTLAGRSEVLRSFQSALRHSANDQRVRPTGVWDKYFDEVLRAQGAPISGAAGDPANTVCIDPAFWNLHMVAPHATMEPWGASPPSEADLLEFTPALDEGSPNQTSCSLSQGASKVDVVVHHRGSGPIDGANVRVTLVHWIDPRDHDAASWSDATTWQLATPVPWTAAVNEVLNSPTGATSLSFGGGWAFVGSTPAARRRTLTGQTLDPLRAGVATFDLDLSLVRPDRVMLIVAVVRVNTDIALASGPLEDLTLSNPNVAVRSLRVVT